MNKIDRFAVLCLFIGILLGMVITLSTQKPIVKLVPLTDTVYEKEDRTLTKENLQKEIARLGIRFPDVVYRQAMLETGNLSCKLCSKDRNNLFGFATDSGYLDFEDWRQSVAYYYAWQKRKTINTDDYYEFLRKRWGCENPENYVAQLRRFK